MYRSWTVARFSLALFVGVARVESATLYVKPTGTGDCSSWANACTLADAVSQAEANNSFDEIWVKAGTYPPIGVIDSEDVAIIGGFAGTETSASQSKPATYVTIIDGGGAARGVSLLGRGSATVLRGLKFANGYDGDELGGGALYLEDSSPTVVDCIFEYNTAAWVGGGVRAAGTSAPHFVSCIFRYNGAATLDDPPYGGGAVFQDGGVFTAVNCLFHDNKAVQGGAIFLASISAAFESCTFAENAATVREGGAVLDLAISTYDNCILWGNVRHDYYNQPNSYPDQITDFGGATSVKFSDVQGGWAGTGNIDLDPLFQSPALDSFKLLAISPCLDAGSEADLPADTGDLDWDGNTDGSNGSPSEALPKDLARKPRVYNGFLDMGAYEAQFVQQ